MRRLVAVLILFAVMLSGCVPAGKTFNDFLPTPSLLSAQTPAQTAAQATIAATPVSPLPALKSTPTPTPTATIGFTNPLFEKAVRELLELPAGEILSEDLGRIVKIVIDGRSKEDKDADKQKEAFSLTSADSNEKLPSPETSAYADIFKGVSPAESQLTLTISVSGGFVELDDLAKFQNLSELKLIGISDFNMQKIPKQLIGLAIKNCLLDDVSALKDMNMLKTLVLSGDNLQDVSVLSSLKGLTVLDVSDNDLTGLFDNAQEFTSLTKIIACGNRFKSVDSFAAFPALTQLDLASNRIISIEGLPTGLNELLLPDNAVTSVKSIKNMKDLKLLSVCGNPINDLSWIGTVSALKNLDISNTTTRGLSKLRRLNLELLRVDTKQMNAAAAIGLFKDGIKVEISAD